MLYLSYGDYPLPRGEALAAPLRSFRSWLLRIECARCQRGRYLAETHMTLAGFGDQRIGICSPACATTVVTAGRRSSSCSPAYPAPPGPVRRIVLIERANR